jgi:hypothetical protein
MLKSLSCLVLLSSCGVCLAGEPVARPSLPTVTSPAAESAVVQPSTPTTAAPVMIGTYPPPPGHPGGVWYRPEAVVPPTNDGLHLRYPYYSYRRPWYPPGPASINVTIVW